MEDGVLESDILIQQLQDTVARAGEQGNLELRCSALIKLGQAYLDKKEAPDALTQFNEALKIALKRKEDKELHARLFGYQGLALKMLGNYDMALQAFRKSNGIASNLRHPLLLCDSYLQIGILQAEMGDQMEAIEKLSQAMEIAGKEQDGTRRMRIAGSLADSYHSIKNFDKALEYYGLACSQARNSRASAAECSFLTKMGNVSLAKGELKTAVLQYEQALEIASAIENRGAEINILGGLFRAHALASDAGLALLYGKKVIQLAGEINHFEAEITNIHALALFLIDQNRYAEAIVFLEQGSKLAEKNHSQEWSLSLKIAAGTALYRSGDHQAAFDTFSQALDQAKGPADKHSEVEILGYLAEIEADRGHLLESIKYAEHAVEMASALDESGLVGDQQMLLAFDYRDLNKMDQAMESCRAAIAAYKRFDDLEMIEKAETFLSELHR